ncbi:MAG: 16S rRNA (guanine(527)-N(7))-methyltransferase RsmG [Frisingicoccus sp.]|uniref:16S rRNA (guanine(527)-N(7))-methyltransferase RsmG n=1 Tax=Frisingicoccus sp. TaxID=1918627 RepID=UPI002617D91F|nr:16S rRNA (guanine(527)-N(7))-methyltransferase RsmG [Frisingicoccus sp.]MDD6232071.1 16S rRNA (guanine(527)-N(7))-methyltransferase RsmG [Frisingicoccus sp.]
MEKTDRFLKSLEKLNIHLNEKQVYQFMKYYEMLIETNKVMNLTAITDFDEVIDKHFVDSLALIQAIDLNKELKVIDIGTGAGFPGIPLKIAFPELDILLLDSLNKRIHFLNQVISELGLENIQTIHGRAEDFGKNPLYREKFDLCVSRAVANLSTLSEYCVPFVQVDGYFISYKSGKVQEELDASRHAVDILGGKVEKCLNYALADTDMERSLVVIHKLKPTKKAYPRKAGKPSKEPLQ